MIRWYLTILQNGIVDIISLNRRRQNRWQFVVVARSLLMLDRCIVPEADKPPWIS